MPKAYKMFRVIKKEKGKLFPLFVDSNTSTPIGIWIEAKEGEKTEIGRASCRERV